MGMSQRDVLIALMTAMQESSLRNLSGGSGSSVGLFQQTTGWGSFAQRHNALWATQKFFSVLKTVKSRNSMPLTLAAQAVQRSAFPNAYAQWESDARRLMIAAGSNINIPFPVAQPPGQMDPSIYSTPDTTHTPGVASAEMPGLASPDQSANTSGAPGLGSATEQPQAPVVPAPTQDEKDFPSLASLAGGVRQKIIAEGLKWLGTPYSWGGGSLSGPTYGIAQGSGTRGFDCSGLVMYLYNKFGIKMPRVVPDQARAALAQGGHRASFASLQPGDLVVENNGNHIMIYIGNNEVLQAPHTGDVVKISKLEGFYKSNFYGIHLNIPGGSTSAGSALAPDVNAMPTGGALLNFPGI